MPSARRPAPRREIEAESTLTDRYQTTVPETVRRALRLKKRDRIRFLIGPGGDVVLSRLGGMPEEDPVLSAFLGFLSRDMIRNPGRLRGVDPELPKRLSRLVGRVKIKLDEPINKTGKA